ncbi:hypothetical protein HS961_10580 [Comamonas piscis]|uniref:PASTA domain-containing protein n=1 Tax=Comamonas piscis TaxID=1562974 RepID=A0A7G5EGW2_9BURK|nr:hypothetical protein [Comamonas piscis]QMV73237.1 hypothetical protein HS961_10580 [Comamonas piscis]WSO36030.1 hypothetical protein VUJ63_10615 [Comamonas piscis]
MELKKLKKMALSKMAFCVLAAAGLTGCWDKSGKAEAPQSPMQAEAPANKNPIGQLQAMLASREAIGLNLQYVERIAGPAKRIDGKQQQFDLQGCEFLLTTDDAKQSIVGVQLALSSACTVNVGPPISADKPIKPSELTFGMAEQYFRPGNYLADCLSMCGNAYDPSIYWTAEGSRAEGFMSVTLSVPIVEDAVIEAASRWRDAMEKSESEDWVVSELGFNCAPQKYRHVAVQEFSGMHPAVLSFGQGLEAPVCVPALQSQAPAPAATVISALTVPKPRSDCDMEYGAYLRSKGLVPKEKSIHGPDDRDFAGYGCAYGISPAPGSPIQRGATVTFRSAWEAG